MSNYFKLEGKFAGIKNRRTTPGGILLIDLVLSVKQDKVPWKPTRNTNLVVTVWGQLVNLALSLKSGDTVMVEGIIEFYNGNLVLMGLKLNGGD